MSSNLVDPQLTADLEIGCATASWQVEGAVSERGSSIWDDFAAVPGAIVDGATGEPACDHLHRYREDLDLLSWLGADAYRFSISWPRVLHTGTGAVSDEGLGFYDRLVDGLLEKGIRPAVTLYHWDLPSPLQAAGGWPSRDTAYRFADYAEVVAAKLADRVDRWATLNEPWCAAFLGYAAGVHAPGIRDGAAAFAAAYHLMLGHGLAVERLRAAGARNVGTVLNIIPVIAETDDAAAEARYVDGVQNRIFLELLAGRGVPADLLETARGVTDFAYVDDADNAVMGAPIDWVGENYYTVLRVAKGTDDPSAVGQDAAAFPGAPPVRFVPRPPYTDMGWEIEPAGLAMALRQIAQALPGVPMWVTENGAATDEVHAADGIHDPARIDYFRQHIAALLQAREEGVDVRGYYAWSLLDNLEWAEGWTKKFGLVGVDPQTQTRTIKDSARWWRDLIAARR